MKLVIPKTERITKVFCSMVSFTYRKTMSIVELCLICYKVLASESLQPVKLKPHLQTNHDLLLLTSALLLFFAVE